MGNECARNARLSEGAEHYIVGVRFNRAVVLNDPMSAHTESTVRIVFVATQRDSSRIVNAHSHNGHLGRKRNLLI